MAADFLKSYGVSLDQVLRDNGVSAPRGTEAAELPLPQIQPVYTLRNVFLARSSKERFDITLDPKEGVISKIKPSEATPMADELPFSPDVTGCIVLPSLCHPHVHLDKPYLLSHPLTSHLAPKSGDFKEALSVTAEAKKLYNFESLIERGNWLVADSLRAGVTHMRAFVEVDVTVKLMCLDAGLELKRLWAGRCHLQICAFAQDPVFSGDSALENRRLMEEAAKREGVEAIGSTPYVEESDEKGRQNIEWAIELAVKHHKHLDYHLDYFLDEKREPLVWHVIQKLREFKWTERNARKTVCLGHCTRMTMFSQEEWHGLAQLIKDAALPVHFVGLPTSDTFMMARTQQGQELTDRKRGTLQVPWMIEHCGLSSIIGINNVGNAFTPQGSADPLRLASMCVGLYQTGTAAQAQLLYASQPESNLFLS